MHFVILLYGDEAAERALTPAERERIIDAHRGFAGRLAEGGKLVLGHALEASAAARHLLGGLVTDGPFAETKEQLGGFYVIEAGDLDEALEWARLVPESPGLVVEVRPVADVG